MEGPGLAEEKLLCPKLPCHGFSGRHGRPCAPSRRRGRIVGMSDRTLNQTLASHPDLMRVAQRLIWWEPPELALTNHRRFLAQVMNIGTWTDIKLVAHIVGESAFEAILIDPPPGVFTARRWNYWHVRFGKLPLPELPKRFME